jgi:hypothetical protein
MDGVTLTDGRSVSADVVVLPHTTTPAALLLLDKESLAKLGMAKDGLHLFRGMVPLEVKQLMFLECEVRCSKKKWGETAHVPGV